MANHENFRFRPISSEIPEATVTQLSNNFKADFFSELATESAVPQFSNYGVLISKKMWMELTNIFFGEDDFEQHDGVEIKFGYDRTDAGASKNLNLIFQAFSTSLNSEGKDVEPGPDGNPIVRISAIKPRSLSYKTGGGGGAGGGTGNAQVPPPPHVTEP
jgi:hypothetical protein